MCTSTHFLAKKWQQQLKASAFSIIISLLVSGWAFSRPLEHTMFWCYDTTLFYSYGNNRLSHKCAIYYFLWFMWIMHVTLFNWILKGRGLLTDISCQGRKVWSKQEKYLNGKACNVNVTIVYLHFALTVLCIVQMGIWSVTWGQTGLITLHEI